MAKEPRTKALVASRPAGARPSIAAYDDEPAEADAVVRATRKAVTAGTPLSEVAVLYRFRATQARFEAAFARAGTATVATEGGAFFDREEVKAVLVPFGQAARASPGRNGLELVGSFLSRAGFDRDHPPDGQGAARERWESQGALLELLEALPGSAEAGASSLLAEVNSMARRDQGPRNEAVTLATLHQAKGLEWDVVFLVAMTDGAMPSVYAKSEEDLAEEERLLHVGLTRARDYLYVTWATTNARGWQNRTSPYLQRLLDMAPAQRHPRQHAPGTRRPSQEPASRWSSDCPHCAQRLQGMAARGLGVCADCVTTIPGGTGNLARALSEIVAKAAQEEERTPEELMGPEAMLRLLYQRPESPEGVAATTGVGLRGKWAEAAGRILKP